MSGIKFLDILLITLFISASALVAHKSIQYFSLEKEWKEMSYIGAVTAGDVDLTLEKFTPVQTHKGGAKLPDAPLIWAIYFDYMDVVKALLKKIPPEMPSLHATIFYQRLEMTKLMVDHKAKIDEPDAFQFTPLLWAAKLNLLQESQILLEKGANPDLRFVNGQTAIGYAAMNSSSQLVELLLKHNADPNVITLGINATPLHYAVYNNDSKSVSLLSKSKRIDFSIQDWRGLTPLMLSVLENRNDVAKILIDSGAKLSDQDFYGNTVVHLAALNSNTEILKKVSEMKEAFKVPNRQGLTACQLLSKDLNVSACQ